MNHQTERNETASQKPWNTFYKTAADLAASTARNVLAAGTLLSTSDRDTLPSPVGAATFTTQNVDIGSRARDATCNTVDGKTGNRDAGGGCAGRAAVLIVLLNDDAVFGDSGEGDALVGYAGDGAGGTVDGLDADA
jgi:hypothetical protein